MKVTLDIPDDFDSDGAFSIKGTIEEESFISRVFLDRGIINKYRGDIKILSMGYKFRALYSAMEFIRERIDTNDNARKS